jgi:transcriptional regulator with XRE-family HTH domain
MTPAGPDVPPEAARLAAGLRELKTACGLSLAALAAKTTYSKSSWERYLNGKALPPRRAVRELCALTSRPAERLLALRDLAGPHEAASPPPPVRAVAGTSAPSAAVTEQPLPDAGPATASWAEPAGRRRRLVGAAVLVCLVAALATALLWPSPGPPPSAVRCRGSSCAGRSPGSMLCAEDPVTLASDRAAAGEQIDIRYSPTCLAVWARVSRSAVGDRIDIGSAPGHPHSVRVVDALDAAGYVFTPMAPAVPRASLRVCVVPAHGERECFAVPAGGR